MADDYKYRHVSSGRLKALTMAADEFVNVYGTLKKSEVIAPALIERLRIIRLLLARAAAQPLSSEDQELLEKILGPNLGNEKR